MLCTTKFCVSFNIIRLCTASSRWNLLHRWLPRPALGLVCCDDATLKFRYIVWIDNHFPNWVIFSHRFTKHTNQRFIISLVEYSAHRWIFSRLTLIDYKLNFLFWNFIDEILIKNFETSKFSDFILKRLRKRRNNIKWLVAFLVKTKFCITPP